MRGLAECLVGLAGVAVSQERHEATAGLLGAASALRETHDVQPTAAEQTDEARLQDAARGALGGKAFASAYEQGHATPMEPAVVLTPDD